MEHEFKTIGKKNMILNAKEIKRDINKQLKPAVQFGETDSRVIDPQIANSIYDQTTPTLDDNTVAPIHRRSLPNLKMDPTIDTVAGFVVPDDKGVP